MSECVPEPRAPSPEPRAPSPEIDWRGVTQEIKNRSASLRGARREWLEDAVQDAALCMLPLASKGRIKDFVAFGVSFVKRRWIDEVRRRRRRRESLDAELDKLPALPLDRIDTMDWRGMLRQAGWKPTEAWSRILNSIVSGHRGTKKIAQALDLNAKTVHESRRRLQRWLGKKLRRPPAP